MSFTPPVTSISPPWVPSDLIDPCDPLLEFWMNENARFENFFLDTLEQVAPVVIPNNQNVILPFGVFNIGENELFPIEDIGDLDIDFIEQFTSVFFICHLECRSGRNMPWTITNVAPQKIHKSRKLCVQPRDIPNNQFTVIFTLTRISGSEQGEICFLDVNESVLKFDLALHSSKEVKIHRNGTNKEPIYCFLHTATCRAQISGQVKYRVSVYCSMNNQRTLIHSFETIPLRNHKWESGDNGKEQNRTNLFPITTKINK